MDAKVKVPYKIRLTDPEWNKSKGKFIDTMAFGGKRRLLNAAPLW